MDSGVSFVGDFGWICLLFKETRHPCRVLNVKGIHGRDAVPRVPGMGDN
jgi:hypothetical protein